MFRKRRICTGLVCFSAIVTGCQRGEKEIEQIKFELGESKKEIDILKGKLNKISQIDDKMMVLESSINEKIEFYKEEDRKTKDQLKFASLEIQAIKNAQTSIGNKNDQKQMGKKSITNKADRYALEMTYPVPGTFGKQLDQLIIEVKNNIGILEEKVRIAEVQVANKTSTANNIINSRAIDPTTSLRSDRNVASALNNMINAAGNDLGALRAALQNAKSIYTSLKNEAQLIEGNGIGKAKQAITDLDEKIKEYKDANINPTVVNFSTTKGRVTFRSIANREEAIGVIKKDIVLLNRYIEKMENFDKSN
jgi:hypothetical protein